MNNSTILNMGFPIPVSGLTSYWKLDETSGTTVSDSVSAINGSAVNGSATNVTWTSGKLGNAASFNGSTSVINYGAVYQYQRNQPYSVSLWYKKSSTGITSGYFIGNESSTYTKSIQIIEVDKKIYCEIYSNSGSRIRIITDVIFTTTNWYHILVTYNGNSNANGFTIYINGVVVSYTISINTLSTDVGTLGNLVIGLRQDSAQKISGLIDEVCIWNRVLTQTEVTRLYNGGKGKTLPINPYRGLHSYWKLDETSGTTVSDSVGSINGTASSAQWVTGKNNNGYNLLNSVYINFGNAVQWTRAQAWSVSCWVKKSSDSGSFIPILTNLDSSTSASIDCYIHQTTGNITQALMYNNASGRVLANYTAKIPTGTNWNHLVFTYNGDWNANNMRCYINGVANTPNSVTNTMTHTGVLGTDLQIGRRHTTTYTDMGVIDEVGLWNRALTQAEVTTLFNNGNGLFY